MGESQFESAQGKVSARLDLKNTLKANERHGLNAVVLA
jgi:hypothetical protein